MRYIPAQEVLNKVRQTVIQVSRILPQDVVSALKQAYEQENNDSAREILSQLLENSRLARETDLPLCQDTGAAVFFVEIGENCRLKDMTLQEVLTKAMVEGYEQGYLRKSLCNPLSRKNTGDNSPAFIHCELVPGDSLKIQFMAKGGGSENMSRCTVLTPAQGWPGIKDFVLTRMAEAGPNPCPPTIVGLGIGGTFDTAPVLAKKALFRPLDQSHPDPEIADLEKELLEEINDLGIGPMGLGGKTTSLGVRINICPCHIASLPLAVNVQCHSSRHQEVVFE